MTALNAETVLSLDALRQQVPSTVCNGRPVSVNDSLVADIFITLFRNLKHILRYEH